MIDEIANLARHFSAEAEQAVLGAVLLDNTAFDRVAHIITADDFAYPQHRLIWSGMSEMIQHNQPVDPITLAEHLDTRNEAEEAGGLAYLGDIHRATPSAANVRGYAQVVRDKARIRALQMANDRVFELIQSGGSADELMQEASAAILSVVEAAASKSGMSSAVELAKNAAAAMYSRAEHGEQGLDIGFVDLGRLVGKLKPGQLVILAARPAMGKSTLARNIAEQVARADHVLFVSLEMEADEIAECMIASLGHADFAAVQAGMVEGEHALPISTGIQKLAALKLTVNTTARTLPLLTACARTIRRKHGLGLIVVDYLQLMEASGKNGRREEIDEISRGLKRLAMDLQVPVLALSQLSRKVEERNDKRPIMSDLRESGSIEQDADKVLMLYRDEYYNADSNFKGMAEALVQKNRRGKTGKALLTFIGDQSRFADAANMYGSEW